MQARSSEDTSGARQTVSRWGALPFDILSIIFDDVSKSLPVQDYNADTARADYTESEAILKKYFLAFVLVCRHWRVVAQPSLIRVLSIRFGSSPTADIAANPRGLLDILEWLDTRPRLPVGVRHLRLIMADTPGEPDSSGCDPYLFYALLRRFPKLDTVELFDPAFDYYQLAAYASAHTEDEVDVAAPIDVNTLLLAYGGAVRDPSLDAALLCFSWFGAVSSFIVRTTSDSWWDADDGLNDLPAPLCARAFMFDVPTLPEVLVECLINSPTLEALRAVRAPFTLYSLLHNAWSQLESIHLDLPTHASEDSSLDPTLIDIDFGEMPHLRDLSLRFLVARNEPRGLACWAVVHTLIETLRSRPPAKHSLLTADSGVRHVTLKPYDLGMYVERPLPPFMRHGPQFARVAKALADVPTLKRCTVDTRGVTEVLDILDIIMMGDMKILGEKLHFVSQ